MRRMPVFFLASAVFFGCSTGPSPLPREALALGGYEILPPEGPGWSATLDPKKGEALFLNPKDPPWHGAGFTMIRVYPAGPPRRSGTAEEVALRTFAEEEARLRRLRVSDWAKDVVTIGGKTLHRLSYRLLQEPWLARVEHYLYFPPDFPRRGVHYGFLVVDLHAVDVLGERGSLRPIRGVIESFRAKEPEPPPEEPPVRPEPAP